MNESEQRRPKSIGETTLSTLIRGRRYSGLGVGGVRKCAMGPFCGILRGPCRIGRARESLWPKGAAFSWKDE